MSIKKDWIVCSMEGWPLSDEKSGEALTFKTSAAAITRAKIWVKTSEDIEAWVYQLSHVVSRPDAEPDVEVVK